MVEPRNLFVKAKLAVDYDNEMSFKLGLPNIMLTSN